MAPRDLEVAEYMAQELTKTNFLYQEIVVWDIMKRFGKPYYYDNENGNPAISKSVLKEFKKLTGNNVVWERGERCWRARTIHDAKGRSQE